MVETPYARDEMVFDNNTLAHAGPGQPDHPSAQLLVIRGQAQSKSVDLPESQLTIGRQEENDLVLNSEKVSRRHARILNEGGYYYVEDLGSFNGTLVNDRKLQPEQRRRLRHKDILQLSDCRLLFLDHQVVATQLGLSIHLDRDRIRKEASEALKEFLDPGEGTT